MSIASETFDLSKFIAFTKHYPVKKYPRGEMILIGDEIPEHVHFILDGYVKVYSIDNDGNEKIIGLDHTNEVFPIGWSFELNDSSPFYYEAYTDCEVSLIPRDDFCHFLDKNPDITETFLTIFVRRYMDLSGRVNSLVQTSASLKLSYTLRFLANRFGELRNGKRNIRNLPLTQQDLASVTGLTRETVNLELKKLKKAGVLRYNRSIIIIDPKRLQEHIGELK